MDKYAEIHLELSHAEASAFWSFCEQNGGPAPAAAAEGKPGKRPVHQLLRILASQLRSDIDAHGRRRKAERAGLWPHGPRIPNHIRSNT